MDAGELRNRISIERPSVTVGDYGHRVTGWDVVMECWAKVRPATGKERESAYQMQSMISHVVITRFYPELKEASGEWRIVFEGREFNIQGFPKNQNEEDAYLYFNVKEGGIDGH